MLLDGTPVRAAAWGLVTPIDRGSHELVATANGKEPWKSVIVVPSDGMSVQAEVPELVDVKVAAPGAPPVPVIVAEAQESDSEHSGVIRIKAHPPTMENVAKVLLPLLSNRPQTDFRNRLVIASANRVRWIRTTAE